MQMDSAGTKTGASRSYIAEGVEASLKRLKTDWIDLYQLHRPDPKTPIEETLEALNALVKAGKVREIGCSNMAAAQIDESHATSEKRGLARFATAQDEYSLLNRTIQRELVPAGEHPGMGLLPYFPLPSGLLTGQYHQGAKLPNQPHLGR